MTESLSAGDSPHGPMLLATDREARFRAIYDREFHFVWSAAKYFGIPAAARDDVVQDVFLTAYRRFDQVHYQVSERAWLYGVTRRVASHWHRGVARRTRRIAALGELTGHVGEAPHERHDAARLLERLLAGLPRGTREVWELTELLGLSGPEIAAELELPLNTVYSRLRLARARLLELAASPELLAAEVAADRRRAAPPADAASRTWALMVPLFGHGKLAAVVAAWTTARAGVMTTLIVAGATAVVAVAPRQAPGRAAPVAAPAEDMSGRAATPRPAAPADLARTPATLADLSSGTAETAPPDPVTRPAYDQLLSRETSPRAPDRDDLALEVGLLDRARARLDARDPAGAAQLLDAHARQFPRGALVDAREAAAVELLCLQGRPADAAAAARRLAAHLPDSVLARRFERFVCPDDPPAEQ
ncbi:Sigma-70 region 2 [Nannocystis exedens]|uniref:Sigma-70 region 2 n=1 Tax=Nannocystis exedens TaxID=54 RepID=A0A1I2EA91_9BACT|nr:sigma-70 family RNA polymerase sigma factor [Nannocystis exedens]PCC74847.1 RNA polymerase sigma factor CnrH [Nannocystis exedens]SFE89852.1 Sigma-70 region 2 [Nannocystis exedens]